MNDTNAAPLPTDARVAPLQPGDPERVDGYRLLGRLGEGGQGRVYLADGPDGERVAVKLLLASTLADPGVRRRIAGQIALTRFLPPDAAVRVLAARLQADPPYLVTEYVAGPSLADLVRRSGPLGGGDLDRFALSSLGALAEVHRAGVVHNDLKPGNILLGPDGVRLADFDIAMRVNTRDPDAEAQGVLGSAAYLAPERLDAGPAERAGDVFAWAATVIFAASGASPFHAPSMAATIRAVERDVPDLDSVQPHLRPLLAACLAKDPRARPTADRALQQLLSILQPTLPAPSPLAAGTVAPAVTTPAWGTPDPDPATATSTAASSPSPAGPARRRPWATAVALIVGVTLVSAPMVRSLSEHPSRPPAPAITSAPVPFTADVAVVDGSVLRLSTSDAAIHRYRMADPGMPPGGNTVPLEGVDGRSVLASRLSADGHTAVVASTVDQQDGTTGLDIAVHDTFTGQRTLRSPGVVATLPDHGDGARVDVAVTADGGVVAWSIMSSASGDDVGHLTVQVLYEPTPYTTLDVPGLLPGGLELSTDAAWLAYTHLPRNTAGAADSGGTAHPVTTVADVTDPHSATDLPQPCEGPITFVATPTDAATVLCRLATTVQRLTPTGKAAGPPLPLACAATGQLAVSPDAGAVACVGSDHRTLGTVSFAAPLHPRRHPLPSGDPVALTWTRGGAQVVVGYLTDPFTAVAEAST